MAYKEYVSLFEENLSIAAKLSDKLKVDKLDEFNYPRQHLLALIRLKIGGRAKLKDISRRDFTTRSNLCAVFRNLEADGLVLREIDVKDRRDTWYSVSQEGNELAEKIMEVFRENIENFFKPLNKEDEIKLVESLKTLNGVLKKIKAGNE